MHSVMHHPIYGWYEATSHPFNPITFALLFRTYIKPLSYPVELMYMQRPKTFNKFYNISYLYPLIITISCLLPLVSLAQGFVHSLQNCGRC